MLSTWLCPPLATVLVHHMLLCCIHTCWSAPLPESFLSLDSRRNYTEDNTHSTSVQSESNNEFGINGVHSRSKRSQGCVSCKSLYEKLTAWQGFHHTRRDKRLLYSRYGYYLVVGNTTVTTKNRLNRKLGAIKMKSVDAGLVTIQGIHSGHYLTLAGDGAVITTATPTEMSLFHYTQLPNFWYVIESDYFKGYYLAVNKRGNVGLSSISNQASLFLSISHS